MCKLFFLLFQLTQFAEKPLNHLNPGWWKPLQHNKEEAKRPGSGIVQTPGFIFRKITDESIMASLRKGPAKEDPWTKLKKLQN